MPAFDRINGQFVAIKCTFAERLIFKRAGWGVDPRLKRWATTDIEKARALAQYAVGAAKDHLGAAELVKEGTVAQSWAEDTDAEFPAPEGLSYMAFQRAGIEYALKRERTLIADPPGLGKSNPVDEPVLTPDGWTTMGKLRVGDFVMGSNGAPTRVTGVFRQGVLPTYKVTFRDGSWSRCNDEHLWAVRDTNRRKRGQPYSVKPLKEIVARGLKTSTGKNKWDIPLVDPVEFPERDFFIGPYTLGVLLGDGYLTGTSVTFSCPDGREQISDRVESELRLDFRLRRYDHETACTSYHIARPYPNRHSEYLAELDRLGLRCPSGGKHIPEEYMRGSVAQRHALLQGLMDTDGSAANNRVTFHSTCLRLAEDVQQLVWSLGGSAVLREYDRSHEGKPVEYQLNVKLNDLCPFHYEGKATGWWPSPRNGPKRFIQSVEPCGQHEHVCISVEAEDRLYVARDYTVTHNTVQAIGVHNARPAKRVLIVCPASLKVNWSREWRRWDVHGLSVGIAMSVLKREPIFDEDGERARNPDTNAPLTRTWTEHDWPETGVVIVNYDMLLTFDDEIKSVEWDMVVFDEAHLLKTATTVRSMCVFGGLKKARKKDGKVVEKQKRLTPIRAACHLYLTGTPILSKPVELWVIVRACDPRGLGRSWEGYTDRYCGAFDEFIGDIERRVTDGASNLDELNRLLRERFMVRRDKKAVLKELPPKTRELIVLPQDKLERPVKKEKSRVESALADFEAMLGLGDDDFNAFRFIDRIAEQLQRALDAQDSEEPDWDAAVKTLTGPEQMAFTEMSEAREEVALAKVPLVAEHVIKLVESEEPVILFAYHKSVITALVAALRKAGLRVGTITGNVAANKRQDVVDAFQNGDLDVVVGNILAMGVGFTMTRGRFVVFAELDWVPAMIEQAEDRAWRNGQLNAVMVQHLVVDGSIEAMMAIRLLDKMGIIFDALDAQVPEAA